MKSQRLSGCGTALVTPFTKSGEIDERSLRSFVDWQITSGVNFVVPCGSTGEAATMTAAEHRRVVEITVEQIAGRVPVVAGAASPLPMGPPAFAWALLGQVHRRGKWNGCVS